MDIGPPTFDVLFTGRFSMEQVRVIWRPTAGRRPQPAIDALIAINWERRMADATVRGAQLFPGPLCRLAATAVANGMLTLTLGPTDYRDFLGTNVDGLAEVQAREPTNWRVFLSDPLGVCATIVTADGWLLVMERGPRVAEYPGWYSVVGGHPTPAHDDGVGGVSVWLAMQDELLEEIDVRPIEIGALSCVGLARNLATAKPELLFEARLSLSRAALEALLLARGDPPEDRGWLWLNDDAAAIQAFLSRYRGRVTPAAAACLTVYARRPT